MLADLMLTGGGSTVLVSGFPSMGTPLVLLVLTVVLPSGAGLGSGRLTFTYISLTFLRALGAGSSTRHVILAPNTLNLNFDRSTTLMECRSTE